MEGVSIPTESLEPTDAIETQATEALTEDDATQSSDEAVAEPLEVSEETESIDYDALAEEDLARLKEEFPALRDMASLYELEDPARFGALRELGLSVREAYLATTTPKAHTPHTYDNRSHLRSSVPRTHGASGEQMSAQQMRAARELFSDLSDSDIVKLYKKVHA